MISHNGIKGDPLLMIPGPTNLHPRVLQVMSEPQLGHTGTKFYSEFVDILDLTKYTFKTKGNVIVFSGSGTSGMEAAASSAIEPGEKVLSLETGFFGKRFSSIAEIYGANVTKLTVPDGSEFDPGTLDERMSKGSYDVVLMTHVETSTGVENRVKELVRIAKKHGALTIVDAVASLGGCELDFDDWGIDIAFAGSQKAIAAPPGAMLMAISEKAIQKIQNRKTPVKSYYYNLQRWMDVMKDPHIYLTTPSTAVLRALRVALQMVKEEGIEQRIRRHKELSDLFLRSLKSANISIFSNRPSPTVTAIKASNATAIQKKILDMHNIMVATGLANHKDDMLRIGHMGNITEEELLTTLFALLDILRQTGQNIDVAGSIGVFFDRIKVTATA
ncbi:MAG: alanine--glyoxylate aminotransferase family protein [Conexivisphaerales archaeon]